jgi:hypothetical protein
MTKRQQPPLALWLTASLIVAALIGGLIGALIMARSIEPDGDPSPAAVVSRPAVAAPRAAPVLPTGAGSTAPLAGAPAPAQPLAVPSQRLGAPLIVLAVVDDESGAPVPVFDVTVLPYGTDPPLQRLKSSEILPVPFHGPSGIFRKDCPAGRWDVVVRAPGYLPGVLDLVVPPELPGAIPVRLSHGPSITGLVYDAVRAPLPDVPVFLEVVRLFTDARPPSVLVARTGGDGRFRFSPLPPGEFALALLEPGNERDRLTSVIVNQGTTDVSLFLAPRHQVVVSVRDGYGRPVRDADIELRSDAKFASGRTQESGQAVLRFLPDGEYAVSVKREGYEPVAESLLLQGGQGEQVRWYTLHESGS